MLNKFRTTLLFITIIAFSSSVFAQETEKPEPGLNEATLKGLQWRSIGPALMAGRVADIAVDPNDRSTWYVGVGSGGVWKTVNRGTTWEPVFDDQASYSIGCVTVDPNNPNVVWVGTGENVSGRHVGYGDGIYKSLDGGNTWKNMGLKDSEHIGMIRVDPRDSDVVYAAVQGPLWSGGGDRGLYKTTDGGETWELILSAGEYTGVNEVHLDPRNPDVLFASTHQRFRNVAALMNGGPESGIHKSTDGGKTWRELTNGIPKEDKGKIGLAISPADPDVVYATIELAQRTGGFWRSLDAGETWEKRTDEFSSGTGPHYYQEIFASPHDVDTVYQVAPTLHRTTDGGKTMLPVQNDHVHGDYHAIVFDPADPDYLLIGSDGGVYETLDGLENWRFMANLPITQFYKVAVDYDEPFYNVYGGTQDNNTQGGPSRTDNVHGIRNSDWFITLFGDGHQPAVDPTNPDIVYSEWQQGNLVRYDRKTGEIIYIQPQPEAGEDSERFNWDAPILISPHDPARLYFASQRVWRSDDRGDSWTAISGDLSFGRDRLTLPMMDRVWSWDSNWDLWAMSQYGTITSLSESPLVEGLLYAGTDDGRVQVSEDGGANWRAVDRLPGVPDGFFVNDIKADLFDADTVYVVVDDHKSGDFAPYILKSTNRGRSWRSISGDLPDRHLVWRLVQDHVNPQLLFAGTEFGVFFTVDGGGHWTKLAGGVPNISFRDLAIQKRENDLVGATFGRSFYVLDDYTPLRGLTQAQLESATLLFPVRDALWYLPRMPLGEFRTGSKSSQGDGYFVAPNPPFGAVVTYYLPESLMTAKEQRREREMEIEKAGGDTPYPGFDALREEAAEEDPAVVLTVRDTAGNLVRRLEGPAKAGFHRIAWDLRYANSDPWTDQSQDQWLSFAGPLAAPGEYTVSLATRVNGVLNDTGLQSPITVNLMHQSKLATATPEQVVAFGLKLDTLLRKGSGAGAAMQQLLNELGAIKQTLVRSQASDDLRDRARAMELEVLDLQVRLSGDENLDRMGAPGPVSVNRRVEVARMGTAFSSYGPAPMHERSLEIAEQAFADIETALGRIFDTDLPALRQDLDEAGVPWTPGRGVPGD
ncbi:MAG: glycosyl hydrolase [Xanthomonadales bacterium]|nr:glycosyl hydrolase [Xanthomonadales bacterium]NIX13504.1 glycosyl hydrolase [Xanthomonadales bacterium]